MTYSLAAVCGRTGQVGVAAMTAMIGVGKLVSHARPRVGAAASQAFMNPYLAIDGLRLLAEGHGAGDALTRVIDEDPGRDGRQFGVVGLDGPSAAWTGPAPEAGKGPRTGEAWACQGNRLAGPDVLDAAVEAFLAREGDDLVVRLLAALDAGEDAGGDTKGHRSATIYILDTEEYPLWDLRIDHADEPLRELHALYEHFEQELVWQIRKMPTRDNPLGEFDFSATGDTV
jgi:uncharacterized Ntn-hydrolase superfamily protein